MNTTSLPAKPLSYAISYGFMSGPLHGKGFRAAMRECGFIPAKTVQQADIVVAHSAGCYLLPAELHAELIVYVGMPLNQERVARTYLRGSQTPAAKAAREKHKRRRLFKAQSLFYLFWQPRKSVRIMRRITEMHFVDQPNISTIFIANRYDAWPTGPRLHDLIRTKPWSFISLPGGHNFIIRRPEVIATIITSYETKLLD